MEGLRRFLAALADLWRGLFGFQHRRPRGPGSPAARVEEHYREPRCCC